MTSEKLQAWHDENCPSLNINGEEFTNFLLEEISKLNYLSLEGLMTMGPRFGNPEDSRPYFKKTKDIFERIKALRVKQRKLM